MSRPQFALIGYTKQKCQQQLVQDGYYKVNDNHQLSNTAKAAFQIKFEKNADNAE